MTSWSLVGTPSSTVDDDGTLTVHVVVQDGSTEQGTVVVTLSPERLLTVLWDQQPAVDGLSGFEAWSREP